ncbi:MAG: hypothetical protein ACI3V0_05680 [Faecousia sp.]
MKKLVNLLICAVFLLAMATSACATGEGTAEERDAPTESPHVHSWTETDTATCEQDGIISRYCSCGVTETLRESPAKGHSWDAGTITIDATCQQAGQKTFTCAVCGKTRTEEIPMLSTHQYGPWNHTATMHYRQCSVCLVEDSGNHNWKEEVIKKPTCKDTGIQIKSCTICGFSETVALQKLTDHTYDSACDEECNVCGFTRTISHTYTTTWSKDYNGHWNECTKCGKRKNEAKHTAGPAATETTDQVCTVCNYVIAAKKPHTHSYGTEWTSDEVGHWHACTGCDEEKGYASHKYDNDCDSECNICGYQREDGHVYDQEWVTTKFAHWTVCSVCGEDSPHEKHIPGPEATEETPQLCTVCGFELAPIAEHTHNFGGLWHQNQDSHWQECSCGELSVPVAHVWDAGVKNRNDTITYTCVNCGAEKTEAAARSGFSWVTLILIILALICLGGIGALVYMLKRGSFDDNEEDEDADENEDGEEPDAMSEGLTQEEQEEKMIDDYYASLDKENRK